MGAPGGSEGLTCLQRIRCPSRSHSDGIRLLSVYTIHEFSVVAALIRQVEEVARQEEAARIQEVKIQIGEFSDVDDDCWSWRLSG